MVRIEDPQATIIIKVFRRDPDLSQGISRSFQDPTSGEPRARIEDTSTHRIPVLTIGHRGRVIDTNDGLSGIVHVGELLRSRIGLIQPPNLACQSRYSTITFALRRPPPSVRQRPRAQQNGQNEVLTQRQVVPRAIEIPAIEEARPRIIASNIVSRSR